MKNILTVTIPSYKQPAQLERALFALTTQTFKNFNVIILDDKSGVDLEKIISKYKENLDITIVSNEHNLGAMKNILKSILLEVDSKYIFSHHEDDYIKNNYLETAITALEVNETASFAVSSAVWVKKNTPYKEESILNTSPTYLNQKDFTKLSLLREPFIFGSVIYRKKDITATFDLEKYHTLCDKVFLIEILQNKNSCAAYIKEPGIFVRDHSLDEKDSRSDGSTLENLINFFIFYKESLAPSSLHDRKLITNGLLLGYANYSGEGSLYQLYKKQKKYNLLKLRQINSVGIYSLLALILGKKYIDVCVKYFYIKKIFTV